MRLGAVTLLLLMSIACGREEAGRLGGDGDARTLDGRTFISQTVTGRRLVDGTEIRLSFQDGRIGATAGCNSLGARYVIDDDTLTVPGEGMSMTEIGCDPARHEQDQWLAGFLGSGPGVDIDGDRLTLSTDDVVISFLDRETADPDRALTGTTWRIDTIVSGEVASSVPGDGAVTLTFPDETSFEARSEGCAAVTGTMRVDATTITFDDFTVDNFSGDDVACPSPWAETLAVLRAERTSYEIEAARLTIIAGDEGIGATA